ncbi:uncharacterized protein LOC102802689 [Saccoglossus kowalevskii]
MQLLNLDPTDNVYTLLDDHHRIHLFKMHFSLVFMLVALMFVVATGDEHSARDCVNVCGGVCRDACEEGQTRRPWCKRSCPGEQHCCTNARNCRDICGGQCQDSCTGEQTVKPWCKRSCEGNQVCCVDS